MTDQTPTTESPPDIYTPGPNPSPWDNPAHPPKPIQARHLWMAIAAVMFALAGVGLGLFQAGWIGPHRAVPVAPKPPAPVQTPVPNPELSRASFNFGSKAGWVRLGDACAGAAAAAIVSRSGEVTATCPLGKDRKHPRVWV